MQLAPKGQQTWTQKGGSFWLQQGTLPRQG